MGFRGSCLVSPSPGGEADAAIVGTPPGAGSLPQLIFSEHNLCKRPPPM